MSLFVSLPGQTLTWPEMIHIAADLVQGTESNPAKICRGGRHSGDHGRERGGHETRRIIRRIDCPVPVVAQASPGPLFRERAGSDETNACAKFRLMDFRFSPSPLTSQAKLCP